jgi:PKD repeat protein
VTCDASGSARAVSYRFEWGNGKFSADNSTKTRSHTYALPGDYTVTLTVTDSLGRTSVDSAVVTVLL